MKLFAILLFWTSLAIGQVSVVGTFKYPDGMVFNGTVSISLTKTNVTNTCSTPVQVVTFKTITVKILNGVLQTLSLYPTPCLIPPNPYTVKVVDTNGKLQYNGKWTVPNSSPVDVTLLDPK